MGEPYEVQIKTTADPSGAEDTKAALAGVGDAAVAIDERQAALAAQKQEIAVAQLKALQAEALGQEEVAATLQREVSLRSLALRLQQESNISEAEAVAIARSRSVEDDKIYGKAGKFKLLQNLGVDSDTAKTLGIAALAAFQLQSYIEESAKYYDDLRITGEKESAELQKQVESWRTMAASAKDLNDVTKLQDSITKSVAEQLEKVRSVSSEGTRGFFQNALDASILYNRSLLQRIGINVTAKTSTEEDSKAIQDRAEAMRSAGVVSIESAQKNAEAVQALLRLPYAEAVGKARDEITRLAGEQESLNRSDVKQEQSWQRKQSRIEALSSAIAQLTGRYEALAQKAQLEAQIALTSDPAKRAALQTELEDLGVKLRIQDQIKKASDDAAISGKALSTDERKAIEDQLTPLQLKLKLLREARDLAGATLKPEIQKSIDDLTGTKPPVKGDPHDMRAYLEGIQTDATSSAQAVYNATQALKNLNDEAARKKVAEAAAIPTGGAPAKPISDGRSAGLERKLNELEQKSETLDIGLDALAQKSTQVVGDHAAKLHDTQQTLEANATNLGLLIEAATQQIPAKFAPAITAINQMPDAFDQGAQDMVAAVNTATGNITESFAAAINKINLRLNFLEGGDWN